MIWCYQIRGSGNRLVEIRCGFRTSTEAQKAGQRARRMIHSICYPHLETLTLVTEEMGPL
jgi:hypothetical protein